MIANYIFASGTLVFAVALVPSVVRRRVPAPSTSFLTAVMLTVFLYAYVTLHFWLSFGTDAVEVVLWWVMFLQGVRRA